MSAGHQRTTKYDTGDSIVSMDVPMTPHAIDMYRDRLPEGAVRPPVAWRRGEDIQHPRVLETLNRNTDPPCRVRVYNHNDDYLVVFVCGDKFDQEQVMTVYTGQTHQHGPTRAYLHSHGPHYREDGGER